MNEQAPELSREELLRRYGPKSRDAPTSAMRRSPFKFLDSYEARDADIFFGRDVEIEQLLRQFIDAGHMLIYGESGAGKSSLVQCGLRSRISDADALFISARLHATGLPTLRREIVESAERQLGETIAVPPESDLVATLRAVVEAASRPVVLFLDQFEELFIFHDIDTRSRFAEDLAAIMQARLNVKLIIGVRQDFLANLSELDDMVAGQLDSRLWLRRMSRENAAQAVAQACITCGVQIDQSLAKSIIQRLDPGGEGVELPYLQVVMDRLYRQAVELNAEQPVISNADVQKLGDVTNILGEFLVEEVEKLPAPDTGRQILKAFVTRQGTRRVLDREAVGREAAGFGEAIPDADLETHLAQLASVRILREIADAGSYELRHDALAATVASWISEVEQELIKVRDNLVNRCTEYEARGHARSALLDEAFLDYLGVYLTRLSPLLSVAQRDFVRTSKREVKRRKRIRQLSIGGGVAGVLLSVVLVAFLFLWQEAERQRDIALRSLEASKAVDTFFVTVSEDTLLNQPGTQDLRTKLLMQARQFYVDFLKKYDGAQLDDQLRRELARTHYNLGEITRATAGDSQALTFYETARDMQLQLRTRHQRDADLLHDLGNTFNALGRTHDNLGERTEALDAYERAFEVRQQLADSDPDNSEYQRKLASTIMNIGLVKRDQGLQTKDLTVCDEAKKLIDRAQQIRLQQVEKLEQALNDGGGEELAATLSRMRQDLARGFFNLAVFEEEMFWEGLLKNEDQAFAAAADLYQQAIDSLEPLSASGDLEIDFLISEYYRKLGNAVADLKQRESAFEYAKKRLEPLAFFNPKVKKYQAALARCHRNLGVLYLDLASEVGEAEESKRKYRDQARSAFEKAIEIFERWKDDDQGIQKDLGDVVERLEELSSSQPESM